MSERPPPPPEGRLITAALKNSGLSVREAASRSGISEGRWRQIAGGYQIVSAGTYAPVRGPAETVARMAMVADIAPTQLEEAGRPDAAEELRRLMESRWPSSRAESKPADVQAGIRELQEEIVELMSQLPPERRERLERLIAEEEQEIQRIRQDRMRRLRELFQVARQESDESR